MGKKAARAGDAESAVLAACLISGMAGHLCTSMFGDYLDDEWGIWIVGLTVAHSAVLALPSATTAPEPAAAPRPVFEGGSAR